MRGLLMFSSYCEAYYADCAQVKRVHHNLHYIIQIFQNIINKSVKAKHKKSFKQQRMSMLPSSVVPAPSGVTSTLSMHLKSYNHVLEVSEVVPSCDVTSCALGYDSPVLDRAASVDH